MLAPALPGWNASVIQMHHLWYRAMRLHDKFLRNTDLPEEFVVLAAYKQGGPWVSIKNTRRPTERSFRPASSRRPEPNVGSSPRRRTAPASPPCSQQPCGSGRPGPQASGTPTPHSSREASSPASGCPAGSGPLGSRRRPCAPASGCTPLAGGRPESPAVRLPGPGSPCA